LMQDRTSANSMKVLLQRTAGPYIWVMCGRRRLGKNFLTFLQHWSGAVMCPACLRGTDGRWP
jgi:hypothetical protein